MTRTHKNNDVPHNHPEAEGAYAEHQIPKYFGKTGFADQAPNKVKKNGSGKGNWGPEVGELEDIPCNHFKPRRRSNSKGHLEDMLVSKFDKNDEVPAMEEEIANGGGDLGGELESTPTNDSTDSSISAGSAKA